MKSHPQQTWIYKKTCFQTYRSHERNEDVGKDLQRGIFPGVGGCPVHCVALDCVIGLGLANLMMLFFYNLNSSSFNVIRFRASERGLFAQFV